MTLDPLVPDVHGPALFDAVSDAEVSLWTYLGWGPFSDARELTELVDKVQQQPDWLTWVVVVDEQAVGWCSYLRISPRNGVLELGGITFSPLLQRTTASTEALSLMIRNAFDLGYRRCEWKCDDLNEPSRRTADRLGFRYEGTFRKATHYKGRSRDTAWYAITDDEWSHLSQHHQAWLDPSNFDENGRQRRSLTDVRTG